MTGDREGAAMHLTFNFRWGVIGTQGGALKAVASGRCVGTLVTTIGIYGRNAQQIPNVQRQMAMAQYHIVEFHCRL